MLGTAFPLQHSVTSQKTLSSALLLWQCPLSPVNWTKQSLLTFADTVLTETRCLTRPFLHLCAIMSVGCGNAYFKSVSWCFSSVWSASVLLPWQQWLPGQQGCHITHHNIQGTLWEGWGLNQMQTCVQVMCLDCLIVGSLPKYKLRLLPSISALDVRKWQPLLLCWLCLASCSWSLACPQGSLIWIWGQAMWDLLWKVALWQVFLPCTWFSPCQCCCTSAP